MLWRDNYELGVPLIDDQHRELFDRVESFMKILRSDGSWESKVDKVSETLEFMKVYVVEHFTEEEEYQEKIDYPGLEAHKVLHKSLVDFVVGVSEEFEKGGHTEQLMQQFGGRLLTWLINHVATEDLRIAKYAIEKGVENNG